MRISVQISWLLHQMVTWFKALCAGGGNVTFETIYRSGGLIDSSSACECVYGMSLWSPW